MDAQKEKQKKMNKKTRYALFIGFLMLFSTLAFAIFSAATNVEKVKQQNNQNNITYVGKWKNFDIYAETLNSGFKIYYYLYNNRVIFRTRGNPFDIDKIEANISKNFIRNLIFSIKNLNIYVNEDSYEELRLPMGELGIFLANKPFDVNTFVVGGNYTNNPWKIENDTINLYFVKNEQNKLYLNKSTIVFAFNSTEYALAEVDYFGFSLLGLFN